MRQAQILILEILNVFLWLIRLRRIAFLDLEQTETFLNWLLFWDSLVIPY